VQVYLTIICRALCVLNLKSSEKILGFNAGSIKHIYNINIILRQLDLDILGT
jgi:hypothetical protein